MRFFDNKTIDDILDMTLYEYSLYMEAAELKANDRRLEIHEQAWAHQAAKATKGDKHPKPVYPTFDKFYFNTYQKNIEDIRTRYEPELRAVNRSKVEAEAKEAGITRDDMAILNMLNGKA